MGVVCPHAPFYCRGRSRHLVPDPQQHRTAGWGLTQSHSCYTHLHTTQKAIAAHLAECSGGLRGCWCLRGTRCGPAASAECALSPANPLAAWPRSPALPLPSTSHSQHPLTVDGPTNCSPMLSPSSCLKPIFLSRRCFPVHV